MTKKLLILAMVVATGIVMISCKSKRSTGRAYMPDMYYSRAHETYTSNEGLKQQNVNFNGMPVTGTVARGDMFVFPFKGDTVGYRQAASFKNPLDSAGATIDMKEAERLYLIYCGICHGAKLDNNSPLYKGGDGPFQAKPGLLIGDPVIEALTPGTMFHVITFGKNAMGSYASQLSPQQRWQVIAYVKSKQAGKGAPGAKTDSTAVKTDTTTVKPN